MLFEQPFARVSVLRHLCRGSGVEQRPVDVVLVQVPYENYRKVFRASQKAIEKEMGAVQNAANDLSQRDPEPDDAVKAIEGMISRVEGLKRKVCSQTRS